MERRRLPKRPHGIAANQASDEHLREPDSSGVEHKDPVEADGPAEPSQPTKPIAYVKPIHIEAPAPAEPEAAPTSERHHTRRRHDGEQRSHPRGGRQRTERSSLRRTGGGRQRTERRNRRHQQVASQEPPEASQEDAIEMALVDNNNQEMDIDFEDDLAPYFPFVGITAAPVGSIQQVPQPSGHWSFMGHQAATLYPCVAFTPLSGTSLHFMQTSLGTHVFGIPEFYTHFGI